MATHDDGNWTTLVLAHGLRTNPVYQAAEERRRQLGAEAMAREPAGSADHVAARLLTDTWVEIADAVTADKTHMDLNFSRLPLTLVWTTLQPAIAVFRGNDPGYASTLEALLQPYGEFLLKNPQYASESGQAVNALFG